MAGRPRHPHPAVERAVRRAEQQLWRVIPSRGHAWARLLCPARDRSGCALSVWSTPARPEAHAGDILRRVGDCPHRSPEGGPPP